MTSRQAHPRGDGTAAWAFYVFISLERIKPAFALIPRVREPHSTVRTDRKAEPAVRADAVFVALPEAVILPISSHSVRPRIPRHCRAARGPHA